MDIFRVSRADAEQARGIVITIDVIRAFSVAGYAFAGGALGLWLVRTVEEALALRSRDPEALLAGEIGGRLIPGFDLNNSPTRICATDLCGRRIIQRTGAGTQGAASAINATVILPCALTNARATATYARTRARASGEAITLLPTALFQDQTYWNEDKICADYVEALIREQDDEAVTILAQGIAHLHATNRFEQWQTEEADFPSQDIAAVLDADRFNFVMTGTQQTWQGMTYVDVQRTDT